MHGQRCDRAIKGADSQRIVRSAKEMNAWLQFLGYNDAINVFGANR